MVTTTREAEVRGIPQLKIPVAGVAGFVSRFNPDRDMIWLLVQERRGSRLAAQLAGVWTPKGLVTGVWVDLRLETTPRPDGVYILWESFGYDVLDWQRTGHVDTVILNPPHREILLRKEKRTYPGVYTLSRFSDDLVEGESKQLQRLRRTLYRRDCVQLPDAIRISKKIGAGGPVSGLVPLIQWEN